MAKQNKKYLAVLSTAAVTGLLTTALGSSVYAKTDKILTQDNSGNYYSYNFQNLTKDAINNALGKSSPLYDDYMKKTVVAFHDDILNSYIKLEDVNKAAVKAALEDKPFDINAFTEAAKDENVLPVSKPVQELKVENGSVVPAAPVVNISSIEVDNGTTLQLGVSADATEDGLVGKTITLKGGEKDLVATYKANSLKDGKATFVLGGEDKLVDAVTYTISADWATVTKADFIAKVGTAYAKTFSKVTSDVVAGANAKIYVAAKNQYGEDIATLDGTVDSGVTVKAATLNGMPIKSDVSYSMGEIAVARALAEGDALEVTLTNNNVDSVISYTVIKGEAAKLDQVTLTADKTNVGFGTNVNLELKAKDQYSNPYAIADGKVKWFINDTEITGQNKAKLALDKSMYKAQGTYVIKAFYTDDTKKNASVTLNIGAAELSGFTTMPAFADGTYNNEEAKSTKIVATEGAVFTADMLKFDVVAKDANTAATDVTATAGLKGGDGADKNDIIITAKTSKAGTYEITPYVMVNDKKISATKMTLKTTVRPDVASMDDVVFSTAELKTGKDIKKTLVFRNKFGEEVVPAEAPKLVVTPTGLTAPTPSKDEETGKYVITLNAADAKTYNVVISSGDVFKSYNLTFAKPTFTTVTAGTDITGVVAGDADDKAKYQAVKFLDQDGQQMDVAKSKVKVTVTDSKGTKLDDLSKLVVVGKTYSVNKDGVVTFAEATVDTDSVAALKVKPASNLPEGTYAVRLESTDNKDVAATFNVTVGAEREAKTIEVTSTSNKVALNGTVKLTVVPKDQYGDFINLGTEKITVNAGDHFKAGTLNEVTKDSKVIGYEVVLTGITKGTNDVTFTIADDNAFGTGDLVAKQSMTVDSVANLVNSIEFDKTDVKDLYSTNAADETVNLSAIAKDSTGAVVPVSAGDLTWSVVSATDKDGKALADGTVTVANGKVTLAGNATGSAVIKVQTSNLKEATITLNFNAAEKAAVKGTTVVANAKDLDADANTTGVQIALDGKGEVDKEENGSVSFTLAAKDQYGADIEVDESKALVSTDDSSVVTINKESDKVTLTAKSEGSANVYVQYNGDTITLNVTVNKDAVEAATKAEVKTAVQAINNENISFAINNTKNVIDVTAKEGKADTAIGDVTVSFDRIMTISDITAYKGDKIADVSMFLTGKALSGDKVTNNFTSSVNELKAVADKVTLKINGITYTVNLK